MVFECAGGAIGKGVCLAGVEAVAAGAGLAICLGDGVGGAIAVGPGDSCADFDGDVCRTERKVFDIDFVRGRRVGSFVGR